MREPAMLQRPDKAIVTHPAPAPARGFGLKGRILLTGATGFVGQAILERLLADHPDTHVTVLMRPVGAQPARTRLAQLLSRPAFGPWRARVGDTAAAATVHERVELLEGDLRDLPARTADRAPYDVVLHCAGDVAFRAPLDAALDTNVSGVAALYDALRAMRGSPHVVHVSTAYVWTDRVALGAERRVPHELDWRQERDHARGLREALDREPPTGAALSRGRKVGAAQRGMQRERAVSDALAAAGHHRARQHGWTDVYTYSKALGERVAEELWGRRPLTIVRPTIIESALERPYAGWLDGFKVADPLFAAYAKGRLPGFPGQPDSVIDIVPVDIVVNAILAAARRPPSWGAPRYVHVGTGVSNPLRLDELRTHVQSYFATHPWVCASGTPVRPSEWRFGDPAEMQQRLERSAAALDRASRMLAALPPEPTRRLRSRVAVARRQLASTREFVRLYGPYSCSLTRYDDLVLRALDVGRDPAERLAEPLDSTSWEWSRYWADIHLPALHDLLLAQAGRAHGRRQAVPFALGVGDASRSRPLDAMLDGRAWLNI